MTRLDSHKLATSPRPSAAAQTAETSLVCSDLMNFARQATAFVATMAAALLIGQIL